jgi:hypothetical protein
MNDFEKIKIIDNYLPEKIMLDLENFLLSNNFPYYYVENIVLGFEKSDSFMFVHHLIENQKESSTVGNSIVNMIMNNVPHKNILRAKINFYLKTDCLQLHDFHLDNPHEDIKIAIFYINTNNGFTEFEDKTIVILDCGMGDHVIFKRVLPYIKNPIIYSCYPEIVPGKSIGEAVQRYGDISPFNIYGKMDEWNWKDSLENAYRKLYGVDK